jgi:UDP-GlcNAc:undecaprenyl-phosphate GlcNAc-1-phosphate transferase
VLGFTLAALGLASSWKVAETTVATLVLPLLVLAVPILDTALVAVTRLVEGRPIHQGGKDHSSHRLVRGGLSEKRAVVLLAAIGAGLGATSLTYSVLDDFRISLIGVLLTFALLVQFAGFLADLERGEAAPQPTGRRLVYTLLLHRRRLLEVAIDFALITASLYVSFLLFVDGQGTNSQRHIFLVALPVILAARYVAFIPLGLYNGVWRFAGSREAGAVVIGVVVSEGVAVGIVAATTSFGDFPLRIFVVDALLCTILIGASRFGERALFRAVSTLNQRGARRRTLVVGAGRSGRSLVRELRETPGEQVVGFLDDDLRLRRRRLLGIPVRGGLGDVGRIIAEVHPDAVLVTIVNAPAERLAIVVAACEAAEIPCQFVRRELHSHAADTFSVARD